MSLTLWPSRAQLRRGSILREAESILGERLWTPIYEEGGIDALIAAGEIPHPPPPPPPSWLPNMGTRVKW